jgi:tRNA G18 (ribose-2'-O)-methylase SpoU
MQKNASSSGVGGTNVWILLHDIRSVYNVGSIFRTADAFGVSKIYISGYTPAPTDRFGRTRADIAKVALGAETTVPWEVIGTSLANAIAFIKEMKKTGAKILVVEQDEQSVSFDLVRKKLSDVSEILLILGNEVGGVERGLLDFADIIAEIPMRGKKESLNVSVAAGIALFELVVI